MKSEKFATGGPVGSYEHAGTTERKPMTIIEIIDREVAKALPCCCDSEWKVLFSKLVERGVHPPQCPANRMMQNAARAICVAVAKAVVEEAAKLAPHDMDCHGEADDCDEPNCEKGCDPQCAQRLIHALAAQGPGGEAGK